VAEQGKPSAREDRCRGAGLKAIPDPRPYVKEPGEMDFSNWSR
jgi:hypothetical protein